MQLLEITESEIYGYLLSYIVVQEPHMQIQGTDNVRTDVLHLALSNDGIHYKALNNEKAVYYPIGNIQLGSPSIFRKPDGSYGLIASHNNSNAKIFLCDSKDLISYSNQKLIDTNSGNIIICDPISSYNIDTKEYEIRFLDKTGISYMITTTDFDSFSKPIPAEYSKDTGTGAELPEFCTEAAVFPLTKLEYTRLKIKYGEIYNTGIEAIDNIIIASDDEANLPKEVTALYSDGSTATFGVTWNTEGLDLSISGTITVEGSVDFTEYNDPLAIMRADPFCMYNKEDEYYYFIASYPCMNDQDNKNRIGYDKLSVRRATTINGLSDAPEVDIWLDGDLSKGIASDSGTAYYRFFWAPEIHKIGDYWYIITYASLTPSTCWGQMVLFKCMDGNLIDPNSWDALGVVSESTDGMPLGSFDTTFMEVNGQCYYVTPRESKIWITTFDAEDPLTPTGPLVQLSQADRAWEYNLETKQGIDEGPAILRHNGKIYICYSGGTVDQHYCVGMIYTDETEDLMKPESWKKCCYPLLTTSDVCPTKNQSGPGHNSFTVDENGNTVIIYHARTWAETIYGANNDGGLFDPGRHARVNYVHYAVDGTPIFNMTSQQILSAENRKVSIQLLKGTVV